MVKGEFASCCHSGSEKCFSNLEEEKRNFEDPKIIIAKSALELYYSSGCERQDFLLHAERSANLVRTFADKIIPEAAYHAVIMHDFGDRMLDESLSPEQRKRVAVSFLEYASHNDITKEELNYVTCLLGDMRYIDESAKHYQDTLRDNQGIPESYKEAILSDDKQFIRDEVWGIEEPIVDIAHLEKIAKTTNIEAVIIKAAETIDHLRHRKRETGQQVIRRVLEAETFYVPLCEVWGFDAMAMTLRSVASIARLENRGHGVLINRARHERDEAKKFGGIVGGAEHIFGKENVEVFSRIEPKSTGGEPLSEFADMFVRIGDRQARIVGRTKTVGSLARKFESYISDKPMDVLAMTLIADNEEGVAEYFAKTLQCIETHLNKCSAKLTIASSKKQPIFIQGKEDYVSKIENSIKNRTSLGEYIQVNIRNSDQNDVYQVAKFTCELTNNEGITVPLEMQFLTTDSRRDSRVGMTAHILYKQQYRNNNEAYSQQQLIGFLEEIHARKQHASADNMEVNKRTEERGAQFIGVAEKISKGEL